MEDPLPRPRSPALSVDSHDAVEDLVLHSRTSSPPPTLHNEDDRQCRICFGGAEDEVDLGRMIRPCLCKGSLSYVHVKCLNQWRAASQNKTSYWSCLQCRYKYHFARTRVAGLATNRLILMLATVLLFLVIVFLTGSIVSYLIPDPNNISFDNNDPAKIAVTDNIYFYSISGALKDVVMQSIHAVTSGDAVQVIENLLGREPAKPTLVHNSGFKYTIRLPKKGTALGVGGKVTQKFLLGLSVVGILSFVNLLLSFSLLVPVQVGLRNSWIRGRRGSTGSDIGTLVLLVFVVIGIGRAMWKVYTLIRRLAGYLLLRAETAILEVNPDDHPNPARLPSGGRTMPVMQWAKALLRFDRVAWAIAGRNLWAYMRRFLVPGDWRHFA